MADIEVERRGPTIWPWVVGLLLLAVIVWALMEMYRASNGGENTGAARDSVTANAGTAFLAFVAAERPAPGITVPVVAAAVNEPVAAPQ